MWLSALVRDENNRYDIDFEDFEQKCKDPKQATAALQPPQPPLPGVDARELTRLGRICIDNGVLVLSDRSLRLYHAGL